MNEAAPELRPGDAAPRFVLNDATGAATTLDDFAGRRLVVYFYPAAFTPGCTTQACDFRDNLASLRGAGYEVVGISTDDEAKLAEFAREDRLDFPLLSDPEGRTAKAWGAWGEKVVNGETRVGTLRSTFVLDEQARVVHAQYRVDADGHVRELRGLLGV